MSAIPHLKLAGTGTPDVHPGLPGTSGLSPEWLWTEDAAARANISVGQVRRLCPTWAAQGLARQQKRGTTNQLAWQVHETADPRFARVKSVDTLSAQADLTALTDTQRQEVLRRERICRGWDEAIAGGVALGMSKEDATQRYLDQLQAAGDKTTRSTLYRWHADYRRHGRAGLFDSRWKNPGCTRSPGCTSGVEADTLYRETLLTLWLTPRKLSLRLAHELASHELELRGLTPPSYSTAKRIKAGLPPASITKARDGKDAFKDRHAPYIPRDYSTIDANAWWCSDHYHMDVMCTHEGKPIRPWLHAWMDVRSRKVTAWALVAHEPNADLILRVVSQGMRQHGAPENAYVDNGKDYDSQRIQGITKKQRRAGTLLTPEEQQRVGGAFALLGVKTIHCWPFHGQSKINEPWHRKVKDRFCRLWETFTGGSPDEKPEDLQKHLKAAPTLEELIAEFTAWIENDHNGKAHLGDSMDGKTPDQVFAECLVSKRTLPEDLIRFACMPRVGPLKIRQNGVHWNELSWNDRKLDDLYGQKVMIAYDVEDLSSVIVLDLEGRVLCRAAANIKLPYGADKQALRDAIAAKKKAAKAMTEYEKQRPRMDLDVPDMMRRMAADKARGARAAAPAVEPPSAAMMATPMSGQFGAIQDVMSKPDRIAVGAESMGGFGFPSRARDTELASSGFIYQRPAQEDDHE